MGWMHKGATKNILVRKLVTIRDDNLSPLRWSRDCVIATHLETERIVRVVKIKTAQGEYKHSIKKLSLLKIDVL